MKHQEKNHSTGSYVPPMTLSSCMFANGNVYMWGGLDFQTNQMTDDLYIFEFESGKIDCTLGIDNRKIQCPKFML